MPQPFDVQNDMLVESVSMTGSDIIIGYSARNRRTRAWTANTMATYMRTQIAPVAINHNTTTNVITITLGDNTVITGTTST
jgi:glutamate 5-kinase